ncbi:hypothetical protein [Chitinophaga skermanii]|nr:hypothetical protein [Chitinophaga skermanii]
MKKLVIILITILSCNICAKAQDNTSSKRRTTTIKVNPTTLINELDLYLEQELSSKMSLEIGITGIYTDYPDYVLSKRIDIGQKKPNITTEQFVDGIGFGVRAGLRWYIFAPEGTQHASGTYFQPNLFYKRVFYPAEDYVFNNTTYKEDAHKDVYGIQLLLGRQYRRQRLVFDPYIGVGLRAKVYRYDNYTEVDNNMLRKDRGQLVSILPSLHLGVKVGLNLKN